MSSKCGRGARTHQATAVAMQLQLSNVAVGHSASSNLPQPQQGSGDVRGGQQSARRNRRLRNAHGVAYTLYAILYARRYSKQHKLDKNGCSHGIKLRDTKVCQNSHDQGQKKKANNKTTKNVFF